MNFDKINFDKLEDTSYSLVSRSILQTFIEIDFFKTYNETLNPDSERIKVEIGVYKNEIDEIGKKTWNFIFDDLQGLKSKIEQIILKYYIEEVRPSFLEYLESDYDFWIETVPDLKEDDFDKIQDLIYFDSIYIPLSLKGGYFTIYLESKWDPEHNLELNFKNFIFDSISSSSGYIESDENFIKKGIVNSSQNDEYYEDIRGLNIRRFYKWNTKTYLYEILNEIPVSNLEKEEQIWFYKTD